MDDNPRPALATVPLREMETRVRDVAAGLIAGPGSPPGPVGVGPVPCDDPAGDLAEDGRYYVTGTWQVPVPANQQRETFHRLRSDWQANGYAITEFRELPDGVRVVMIAEDPDTGFGVSLSTTEPPEAVALSVTSPCVMSPDGKYPG